MQQGSLATVVLLVMGLCAATTARASTFHVSTAGDDIADGSEATPFLTIQHCADGAEPGDTCRVHAGIYRETVTPPRSGTLGSPIRFEAAEGECVTISGTDPLSSAWTHYDGAIWRTRVSRTITQLFLNGAMLNEARWPNADPADLVHMPLANAGMSTHAMGLQATDAPSGDWTNATILMLPGLRWHGYTRRISQYDETSRQVTFDKPIEETYGALTPRYGDPYLLFGSLLALDTEGEWYFDTNADMLYLWAPGSADPTGFPALEYKRRSYAFDVIGLSDLQIVGFQMFAAALRLNAVERCTVDAVHIRYPTHLRDIDGANTVGAVNLVSGSNNVWKNSVIAQSATDGLVIQGNGNQVVNNIVHDVAYLPVARAGLEITAGPTGRSERNWLIHNTIYRSGASAILLGSTGGSKAGRVLYNRAYAIGLQIQDMGIIGAWGLDGEGTEIAYNELSDIAVEYGAGVYLDAGAKRFIVHHNYIHDSLFSAANFTDENLFFHNTVRAVAASPVSVPAEAPATVAALRIADNLYDELTGIELRLHTSDALDYGDYKAFVTATNDWAHVEVRFDSMRQPLWAKAIPFDLTKSQFLAFSSRIIGEVDLQLDNLRLEGDTPLLLAAFDSGELANILGQALTTYVGPKSEATLSLQNPGAFASAAAARMQGRWIAGGAATLNVPLRDNEDFDLSPYSGISFDVRATSRSQLAVLRATPEQRGNASCPLDEQMIPTTDCAVDQGEPMAPYTDGYVGTAPDLGAFESGLEPWTTGAEFAENDSCQRPKDATFTLPPVAPYPGMEDPTASIAEPRNVAGSGCSCRMAEPRRVNAMLWFASMAAGGGALRRRRSGARSGQLLLATLFVALQVIGCRDASPAGATDAGGGMGGMGGVSGADAGPNALNPCDPSTECPTAAPTPGDCTVVAPTNALIVDFRDVGANGTFLDGDACSTNPPNWWESFYGGTWLSPVKPDRCATDQTAPQYALSQDLSASNWHIAGTIQGWSGMGLWFGPCMVDMSAYDGVSFLISGNVGSIGTMTFTVMTSANHAPDPIKTNVGTCTGNCRDSTTTIDVTATPTRVVVPWTQLTGGSPKDAPDPAGVTGLMWSFNGTGDNPFAVDVTLDEIRLVVE